MDWSTVSQDMAEKILGQGETFLQATLTVASGLDQRSATLAGIFSASATAALAASAAIQINEPGDSALVYSGLAVAAMWFFGASLCVAALWPSKYHLPGNHPRNWWPESVSQRPMVEAIGGESENYQERIDYNVNGIKRDTNYLKSGAAVGCAAPLVGLLTWFSLTWASVAPAVVE